MPSGLSAEDVLQLQEAVHRVTVDEALVDYMLAIVEKTAATNRWRWASARAARRRSPRRAGAGPAGRPRLRHPGRHQAAGRAPVRPPRGHQHAHHAVPRRADAGERIIEEILSQVEVPL